MLIHSNIFQKNLNDFGIEVPILKSRSAQIFEFLSQQPEWDDSFNFKGTYEPISFEHCRLVHDEDFVKSLENDDEQRIIDCYELKNEDGSFNRYQPDRATKPLKDLIMMQRLHAGGTLQCLREALTLNFCYFLGGGMHHAQANLARGFCLINDIVVGLRVLQQEKKIKTAWVLDIDAHKGDGTATLTQGDSSIKTFSVHMAKGWPLCAPIHPKSIPASDFDLPVRRGEEESYNQRLTDALNEISQSWQHPDIAIVVAGTDVYDKDVLPSANHIKLSRVQVNERDRIVYEFLKEKNIPQAYVMSGGYGPDVWEVTADFLLERMKEFKS